MLVVYHVVGTDSNAGLRVSDGAALRYFNDALSYFIVPLFAFISGLVYALRPPSGGYAQLVRGKARRLLLPVLLVGTAFAVLQARVAGSNAQVENWWLLHIEPVGHFWFLQALFLIFLVVGVLERLGALRGFGSFAVLAFGSALLQVFWAAPVYLGLDGAVSLLPFFLGGLAYQRFGLSGARWTRLALFAFVLTSVAAIATPEVAPTSVEQLTRLMVGMAGAALLVGLRLDNRFLAYIGSYSFAIYLFHVFFTAGSRMGLNKLGVTDLSAMLFGGVSAGLVFPLIAAWVIARFPAVDWWVLGNRPIRRRAYAGR